MEKIDIHPVKESDRKWMSGIIKARWGEERVIAHGFAFRPAELPGFIAIHEGEKVGLLTFNIDHSAIEIITLDSLKTKIGVGSQLVDAMKEYARKTGCKRLWLITTNDNLQALRFYQKRGFHLAALHKNALDVSRMMKPLIPTIGRDGIPARDELEMEIVMGGSASNS
ncbi:MAG: GNAT family N-acetyltransferase [Candidatus Xenobiia bacterium LiM19]